MIREHSAWLRTYTSGIWDAVRYPSKPIVWNDYPETLNAIERFLGYPQTRFGYHYVNSSSEH